jgi:predicted ATPase
VANLAALRPLLLAVDDAHWADEPSQRLLAYLAPRLGGLSVAMLVTLRPGEATSMPVPLVTLRAEATTTVQPALLSRDAVTAVVHDIVGDTASDELCGAVWKASGGNPLYLTELLRAITVGDRRLAVREPGEPLVAVLIGAPQVFTGFKIAGAAYLLWTARRSCS